MNRVRLVSAIASGFFTAAMMYNNISRFQNSIFPIRICYVQVTSDQQEPKSQNHVS